MKWTISAIAFGALSGLLTTPPTFSQDFDGSTGFAGSTAETEFALDLTLIGFASDDAGDDLLFDIDLSYTYEDITDAGRRYGFRVAARAERDTGRIAWGGQAGDCPAGLADCPAFELRGYTSGLYAAEPGEADSDPRAAIQDAYFYTHSGWGEWRIGYGAGAPDLDAVGGPAAFRAMAADGGRVDPTGLAGARTRNLTSGYAPKISFRSIMLGQLSTIGTIRASASFTPEMSGCGVDVCLHGDGPGGLRSARPANIIELGGVYEWRRGVHDIAVSLGLSRSEESSDYNGLEGVRASDVGVSWRAGNWQAGARWLRANNGVEADGSYEALSASAGYESGAWMTTLEWAGYSDDLVHADGETWQLGTSWLGEHWLLGAGVQTSSREETRLTGLVRRAESIESTVIFVEASWRY